MAEHVGEHHQARGEPYAALERRLDTRRDHRSLHGREVSVRKVETLARIPLLRGVPPTEIGRLDTQCVWRRAKAGGAVLDIGEGGADLYFVAHGKLRVTIQAISGRESILRDLGDGEFFGELA